jgi:cytochrome c-type protein NapB
MRALCLVLATTFLLAAPPKPKAEVAPPARKMTPYAPPVIPHPVEKDMACTDCHGVADSGAPALPHKLILNCTACHIEQTEAKDFRPNTFKAGREQPGPNRATFKGAPPAIPHHTQMREKCISCHGEDARFGIKHPHPKRANCTACHLPSGAGK